MGVLSMLARLDLNASGFSTGINTAEKSVDRFSNKLRNQVGGALLGVFGIRSLANIGRQAISSGHAISQMAEKFNLTTDEVQLLQQETDRTGESFESLVKDATKLEATLGRLRGVEVIFSRQQVEALESAHQVIKEFNNSFAIEWAKLLSNPLNPLLELNRRTSIGRLGGLDQPAASKEDPAAAFLEAEAAAARQAKQLADVRIANDARILKLQEEIGEVIERTRVSQLSKEERLVELQSERLELVRQLQFELTKEGEAQKQLAIAKNAEEMARIQVALAKKENVRSLPAISDSLRSVGRFGGENPNSPAVRHLTDINAQIKGLRQDIRGHAIDNRFPL